MRLDDDPDVTLEEMLVFARRFPFPLLRTRDEVPQVSQVPPVPQPRSIRLPDTPVFVPDTCLTLVAGPLVGL